MVSLTQFIIWHTAAPLPDLAHLLANNKFDLMLKSHMKPQLLERNRQPQENNGPLHQLKKINKTKQEKPQKQKKHLWGEF